MNHLIYAFKNIPKSILILLLVLVLLLITTIVIYLPSSQKKSDTDTSPNVIYPQNPSQQAVNNEKIYSTIKIGETTINEVKQLPEIKNQQVKGNQTEFSFNSGRYNDNKIITENGLVIFKNIITVDPETWQHPPLSSYLKVYGQPEAEYTGSNTYGSRFKTYLYPSKGLAFIGNPGPDELYEIQVFEPLTLDQYLNKWGSDINETLETEHNEGSKIGR